MGLFNAISDWFWNPRFWLPEKYTWEDLKSTDKIRYPLWKDLWIYPLIIASLAIGLRYFVLNKYVFGPIATYFGIKNTRVRPVRPDEVLEKLYMDYGAYPPRRILIATAKRLDRSERSI
ncbi:UNVERIFIED_CONTAM: hypothetical protein RMT77_005355 [Armadillidium vulgare]